MMYQSMMAKTFLIVGQATAQTATKPLQFVVNALI